jgi:hypothetical protein
MNRKYVVKMNPLKCAFGVPVGKFLGFIVHQHNLENPSSEFIQKIQAPTYKNPTYKREMQKFLGKLNCLKRFLINLSGKADTFTQMLR